MFDDDLKPDPLWYKDAIIYELHVRAFSDSNADGMGDFKGLTSRLDYLEDLGVTAIWLLPFCGSKEEFITKLGDITLGTHWYIQFDGREPVRLADWLRANYVDSKEAKTP